MASALCCRADVSGKGEVRKKQSRCSKVIRNVVEKLIIVLRAQSANSTEVIENIHSSFI